MSEQKTGFARLIESIPVDSKVLDVGGGGLHGENTTDYLLERFTDVTCVCWSQKETDVYEAQLTERKAKKPQFIHDDYYELDLDDESFDLVVTDLNIENNLERDWSDEGAERVRKMLKPSGMWINYVMTTDQYGDEETSAFIREFAKKLWNGFPIELEGIERRITELKGWEVVVQEQEQRRPYILWVALRKI